MPPRARQADLDLRLSRLRDDLGRRGVDALVVTSLVNILYLSNFEASAAMLVVAPGRLYLLTDFRYIAAFDRLLVSPGAPTGCSLVRVDSGSYDEALAALLAREWTGRRVGVESSHLTLKQYSWLTAQLQRLAGSEEKAVELIPTEGIVEGLRVIKDAAELDVLREAGRRLSEVARALIAGDTVRTGRSERDVAADIDLALKRAGFSRPAFETIVAGGPNAALPHARPSDRILADGDLVVLDFGGVLDGYSVDLTRTLILGEPDVEARRLYRAVAEAQDAALAAVAPGVTADVVDAAARDVLVKHCLGEAFGHGTGHGLGLDVHEEPRVGRRRAEGPEPALLAPGMVITIEPGAYVPGFGGVRIEDDVIVTGTGSERITDVPRDARLLDDER